MRQVRAWAATCALLAMSVSGSARADEPGLFSRMFSSEEQAKPQPQPSAQPMTPQRPTPPPDPKAEAAEQLRLAAEELNLHQRIIDQCRLVALGRPDEAEVMKRLDAMEVQAQQVYNAKIAHLPVARLQPTQDLDTRLGQGVAVNPLNSTQPALGAQPTGSASLDRGTFQGENR